MNLYDEIERLAYELYERSGCIPGRCLDNWLDAERLVLTEIVVVGEMPGAASAVAPAKRTRQKRTVKPQMKKTEKKAAGTAKKGAASAAKGRAKKKT